MPSNGNAIRQVGRALAQIESDLSKAEAAFADAETRLRQAEDDRRAALDTINAYQREIDTAIEQLRQRGTPGSNWRPKGTKSEEPLILEAEAEIKDPAEIDEKIESANPPPAYKEFDRLKQFVQNGKDGQGSARSTWNVASGSKVASLDGQVRVPEI